MVTKFFGLVARVLPIVGPRFWQVFTVIAGIAVASTATSETIVFDFDDGTMQGWTNILTSVDTPSTQFEPANRSDAVGTAHSGNYRMMPDLPMYGPPDFEEDFPHFTLLARSPEFQLGATGSISLFLATGSGNSPPLVPDFASLPEASSFPDGFLGIALRRASDGAFVLWRRKSSNTIGTWEQLDFTNQAIADAGLIGVPLTLDLIDYYHGSFGWVALDTVTINTGGGVPGDFDSDGDVDGADFVAWQTHFPTPSEATLADGDADGDGDVDGADFVVWQTNFPFTSGSGVTSIPEPCSIVLTIVGVLIVASRISKR